MKYLISFFILILLNCQLEDIQKTSEIKNIDNNQSIEPFQIPLITECILNSSPHEVRYEIYHTGEVYGINYLTLNGIIKTSIKNIHEINNIYENGILFLKVNSITVNLTNCYYAKMEIETFINQGNIIILKIHRTTKPTEIKKIYGATTTKYLIETEILNNEFCDCK